MEAAAGHPFTRVGIEVGTKSDYQVVGRDPHPRNDSLALRWIDVLNLAMDYLDAPALEPPEWPG